MSFATALLESKIILKILKLLLDDESLEDVCNVGDAKTEVNIKADKVPCDLANIPAQCSTEICGNDDFQILRRLERLKRKV